MPLAHFRVVFFHGAILDLSIPQRSLEIGDIIVEIGHRERQPLDFLNRLFDTRSDSFDIFPQCRELALERRRWTLHGP
jgi:hypothetical protein